MSDEPQIVNSLAEANVGDTVWLYNSQLNRYVGGKYVGRGVWSRAPISEATRLSFVVGREKFDRQTGRARSKNDYNTGNSIAGAIDRENMAWKDLSYSIARKVECCTDAAKLKAIAAMFEWEDAALSSSQGRVE